MKQLALLVPGSTDHIDNPVWAKTGIDTAGALISKGLEVVVSIVAFIMFFWMVWGIFQYLVAGGNKEQLARARARIMWAGIGFFVTLMAFTLSRFLADILGPRAGGIPF